MGSEDIWVLDVSPSCSLDAIFDSRSNMGDDAHLC
jgi:hypothetical protein